MVAPRYEVTRDWRFLHFADLARQWAPRMRPLARRLVGMSEAPMFLDAAGVAEPRRHMLERLLAAVQRRVRYVPDPVGQDPVTTWETARGDCKDSAVLFASMAVALGARVRLMAMGWKGRPSHVCAQVALDAGAPWLWAETTLDGARLGEHPTDALRRLRLEGTRDDLGG